MYNRYHWRPDFIPSWWWLLILHTFETWMLVLHTRWTLWHHKMDAILSQFFPWMLVHHTRKSADFSKIPWSLVLHTSWMLFCHTRGWTFFLHTMDVKDGALLMVLTSYTWDQNLLLCNHKRRIEKKGLHFWTTAACRSMSTWSKNIVN